MESAARRTVMKKNVFSPLLSIFLGFSFVLSAAGQASYNPPEKDTKFVFEFGAGLGGYYGTLGSKLSVGGNRMSFDLGLGLGPLAKGFAVDISPGISVFFGNRYQALRPKLSLFISSIGHTINVMEKMSGGTAEVLYQEHFPGAGFLAGADWRIGKESRICVDVGLGYVYPFKGYKEVKRIMDDQVAYWRSRGYDIEDVLGSDTVTPIDYIAFSIGVSYALGRSLAAKY
jgi:hypothetical protein